MSIEIPLKPRQKRPGAGKNTGKGKGGGNMGSGSLKHSGNLLPVGIRKHPRRKYGS